MAGGSNIVVRNYTSEKQMRRDVDQMAANGWTILSQSGAFDPKPTLMAPGIKKIKHQFRTTKSAVTVTWTRQQSEHPSHVKAGEPADVVCGTCGREATDDDRFCRHCGTEFGQAVDDELVCANCGAATTAGDRFCSQCGTEFE